MFAALYQCPLCNSVLIINNANGAEAPEGGPLCALCEGSAGRRPLMEQTSIDRYSLRVLHNTLNCAPYGLKFNEGADNEDEAAA